jgi:putative ABC transport system ATP-binding protein
VSALPEIVLRLDGVWLAFVRGRARASVLEDVSLTLPAGEVGAVIASREHGKTTLIRVASGTLAADKGRVLIDGRDMTGIGDKDLTEVLARKIGIATRIGPDAPITVADYLVMSLNAGGELSWRERERQVQRTLRQFELSGTDDLLWPELSKWQQVLVEFAQAVIRRPRLLLIDDILDGLEFGAKDAALEMIEGFATDICCGVLMAVSDQATAIRAGHVWHLSDGKLRLMHPDPDVIDLYQRREARTAEN